MALPLSYSLRNLWTRKLTTALTAGGMALVVFVFAAVLMLEAGLNHTLVDTGNVENVIAIRKGAGAEIQSGILRPAAALIESQPQVEMGPDGAPLSSKETVVLISLQKRSDDKPSNVTARGVGLLAFNLRPQIRIAAGRVFRPGSHELVVGKSIASKFQGAGLGEVIHFAGGNWIVVGIMDSDGSGFDSEIWGDAEQLMPAFRRQSVYSSMVVKLADPSTFDAFKHAIETDPRLTVEVKRERQFYADQSEAMATFIRVLGMTLTVIFSIGAIIGAMITMYSAVANRTAEIGTLRALGFRRSAVMGAFLVESLLLALVGGAIGLFMASFMQLVTVSTMNFQSFAELAFGFAMTPGIIIKTLLFSLLMGLIGGFLPAARAARMNIVTALRSV